MDVPTQSNQDQARQTDGIGRAGFDAQAINKSLEDIARKLDEMAKVQATNTQALEEIGRQMEELRQDRGMI